ncbi:TetR/AcrR family transcriptional regulator [Pseudomaricurvus alkylphenolicus]|jgi:AcrR family transcriptional regulator|uniref:TetR/AcrR family transcriptional regulator n=1 Tax=Pseudomaricurvus alkylphenolicus TaxID=1306991 RepID=UPI00141D7AC1|nr:TetR/AcrR family transcriptional regulator [Pseudomaricurvus alkylphenolicus]NIB42779.1 TetR/AcrR family transcriptional regulator [Pseudomaricurvus alkylphenolicus]
MAAARKKVTRQSREVRIKAILEAAREVFEERGYDKATVAEIAEKIDVVEGTVFSYFSSKRTLVLKVMEQFYEQITELIESGIKGVEGTRNRLHYVIWNHLNIVANNSALCGVILRESRGLDIELAQQVHELNKRYTHIVVEVIREGIEQGDIQADTSATLVRNTIFGTIEHYLWDLVGGGVDTDIDAVAADLTNLVFEGISAGTEDVKREDVSRLIKKLNELL